MTQRRAIVVAGAPGTGKSSFAEALRAELPGSIVVDKDEVTGPVVAAALEGAEQPLDLDGAYYKQWLSPACYEATLAMAAAVLDGGCVPIVVAPYERALGDATWHDTTRRRLRLGELAVIWMDAAARIQRERLARRAAPRDRSKLDDWEQYLAGVPLGRRPPWPHEYVDTTDYTPDRLQAGARELATQRFSDWATG